MRKPNQLKRMVPLLLPVVLIIGVLFFYYHGKALNASTPDALVSVTVGNEAVQNDSLTTEKETVELTLQAKETDIFELPYDDTVSIVPLDEEGKETNYPQLNSSDFKKSEALKLFENRLKTEQSSSDEEAKEEDETEETTDEVDKRFPYYQVRKDDDKGSFIFELEKDQVQRVRIARLTKKEKSIDLKSLKDTNKSQSIVVFKTTTEQLTETLEAPSEMLEPESNEEQVETPVEDEGENPTEEQEADTTIEKAAIAPQEISITEPFKVNAYVGKETGNGDMDTIKGPGYDTSKDDDIVRTFDLAAYRVTMGIENFEEIYSSFQVRLDAELPNAWRKDSSGQTRRTAEFENGTVTDTGSGTKKSTRTVRANVVGAMTAQVYFAENIRTYGGVNEDELDPHFTVTIEKATLKSTGETVDINQVIDRTIEPKMKNPSYISAKPYIDIKMTWNKGKMNTFEKATDGNTDKPFSMVSTIAAYAQLKPLPDRSDVTSIKGSTYPVGGIEYTINQKMIYKDKQGGTDKELVIGSDTDPMQVITYDGLVGWTMAAPYKFTSEFNSYANVYKPQTRQALEAPVGYTRKTYPPSQTTPNAYIGVYDTGNPKVENISSNNSIKVTNTDYVPVSVGENKWYLRGNAMGVNDEPFSVVAMQFLFPYKYLEDQKGITPTANMDYILSIDSVKYEGKEQEIKAKNIFNWTKEWPGDIKTFSAFNDIDKKGLNSDLDGHYKSDGDGVTSIGNKLWGSVYASTTDSQMDTVTLYGRWNANSFKYDPEREFYFNGSYATVQKKFWGVGTKKPDMNLRIQDDIDKDYTWYSSASEAKAAGDISAVKLVYKGTDPSGYSLPRVLVPLIAIGDVGAVDNLGNPNILLTNAFNFKKDGTPTGRYFPTTDPAWKYEPSRYQADGTAISLHSPADGWGDTLYIAGMIIRPTVTTDKKTYTPEEIVKWTVKGKVESGSENNHKVQFEVTIPKETQYTAGTAKDYHGNPLPDPKQEDIIENADGTWTLKWILDYTAKDSTYNPTVVFDTSIISSKLSFNNNVASLSGKVIADVWLEEDKEVRDTSDVKLRTSKTDLTVTNSGVIIVDKVVDKPYIENGNEIDPAKPTVTHPTDFTYTISFKNHSSAAMTNVKVLDVLPKNGDGRGTNFHGSYLLTQVKQTPGSVPGAIYYTDTGAATIDTDPNEIPLSAGWYKLGSDMSVLKNAKALMAVYDQLDPGKDVSMSLTMRPNGQEAGDKYVNSTALNSNLNRHVRGVNSTVRVYGRDLSGVAWYDDNLDGLIGNKPSGGAEEWAKDIPVKLYRTSLEVPSYKNKLVEESLTGEKFIDPSGNSLVKTNENGKYQFNNLPEGNYLAEFVIDDKVVQREFRVTKKEAGSDESLNSKADQTTYKTKDFAQPILSEVAGLGAADSKNHVEHVNLGLVRPSTIRLFKFATGTAIDGDGDGKLSEAEKATGTPLKNAEFEVYEGDASSPFAKETTDESGNLSFVKLFPGEHTLIETKAPEGYELIKSPIKVTITEGNQTIQVYQEDDKKTDLPFTGGTGPMLLLLIIVSGMGILGLGGLYWYYRQPSRKGEG